MLAALVLSLGALTPEERAIEFLSREVPRWPAQNHCFSCHNNGDAARALYEAAGRGFAVPTEALERTSEWLSRPLAWDENRGDPGSSDKVLARIQFASALTSAVDARLIKEKTSLRQAATLLANDQLGDGSWRLDSSGSIGSPATYGTFLATSAARRTLKSAGSDFEAATARADLWLRETEVKTVLDAAAVVLGLGEARDESAVEKREHCLEIVRKGEAPTGGWGPYVTSAPEPFDTAVVLLALASLQSDAWSGFLSRGRGFLLDRQLPDGSWPETTRPPGQRSYAQYISTTGWATLALLATQASGNRTTLPRTGPSARISSGTISWRSHR